MPPPVTSHEFLDLIQRSGVVDESKLKGYIKPLQESDSIPVDPAKFAGQLIRDGILTYFQAEQLLQGKYKRFSLGKYRVLEKLGTGGMASVFLCEHKLMRRRVAIKVLPIAKADDPSSLERFYREARAVAAVDHPNIVRAYDIDQDENLHFLVMEYVDGTNLQDLVKKFGQLDVLRSCHYIYSAAIGLQHAHEMGLVHRDIKPGNILLDRSGVIKILDMGLARFFYDEDDVLTKKYDENVLGTADYLAPEQAIDSHAVDIRADIYSLGATFYCLLTGSAPFPEGSVAQKLIWHQNRTPRPIKSLRPDAPDALVAIVDKMMSKDANARFQTPADVISILASWVTTPIAPPSEREMPQLSLAAGATNTRGPATVIGAGSTPSGRSAGVTESAPTVVAKNTAAPPPKKSLLNSPGGAGTHPAVSGQEVWETLESDTDTVARGDTDRSRQQKDLPQKPAPAVRLQLGKRTILASGLFALLCLATGIYFLFIWKPSKPTPPPQPVSKQITVSKIGGDNVVPTLREALSRANPGDTIVIEAPRLVETNLRLDPQRHKDLTIEGNTPDGRAPIIEAAGVFPFMLDATSVEGVRIRNIEFDGANKADVGLLVSGFCPGLTLDHATISNCKSAGIRIYNAAGDAGHAIVIDRVRVRLTPTGVGILLAASASLDNKRVLVRNCRIEGPGHAGIHVDGSGTDLEFTNNRLFNLQNGFSFPRLGESKTLKARLTNNTLYQTTVGLLFPFIPAEQRGTYSVTVDQNYFAKSSLIVSSEGGPIPGVTGLNNAHDPESGLGNFPFPLTKLDTPILPVPDPNKDTSFLRFPSGPPEVVVGKRVGAS